VRWNVSWFELDFSRMIARRSHLSWMVPQNYSTVDKVCASHFIVDIQMFLTHVFFFFLEDRTYLKASEFLNRRALAALSR
jgi:hypothetical protein